MLSWLGVEAEGVAVTVVLAFTLARSLEFFLCVVRSNDQGVCDFGGGPELWTMTGCELHPSLLGFM
jgi:hypothetical protein